MLRVVFTFVFVGIATVIFTRISDSKLFFGEIYIFPSLNYFPTMPVNPENTVSKEGVQLGRMLFYDPILSSDSVFSCSSCHKQANAFADDVRLSVGLNGDKMKFNTPPLFNLAWYESLFWDGRAANIETQAFEPVRNHEEMNLDWKSAEKRLNRHSKYKKLFENVFGDKRIDSVMIVKVIAQFERTILSYRSKFDRVLNGEIVLSKDEYDGFVLMNDQNKGNCLHCHTTDGDALGTTGKFANNGLDSIPSLGKSTASGKLNDVGVFKIPSLRNLGFTAPYMHDGRFKTLEEVLDFYDAGVKNSATLDPKMESHLKNTRRLTNDDKRKIILFLNTMNDSLLVNDTLLSSPFEQ